MTDNTSFDIETILKNRDINELKKYLENNKFPNKKISHSDGYKISDYIFLVLEPYIVSSNMFKFFDEDEFFKHIDVNEKILKILFEYNPLFNINKRTLEGYPLINILTDILNIEKKNIKISKNDKIKLYDIVALFIENKSFKKELDNNYTHHLTHILYDHKLEQISDLKAKYSELEEKYSELEKENEMLKEQIYYAPDGDGAKAAKEHFIQTMAVMEKN